MREETKVYQSVSSRIICTGFAYELNVDDLAVAFRPMICVNWDGAPPHIHYIYYTTTKIHYILYYPLLVVYDYITYLL